MGQIFRIATCQAIREIIEENAVEGRFGLILTEEGVEKISHRIVDLFEMTIQLRTKTQEIFSGIVSQQQPTNSQKVSNRNSQNTETPPFPKTKNASEIYDFSNKTKNNIDSIPMIPTHEIKLPRTRFELSTAEKERVRK